MNDKISQIRAIKFLNSHTNLISPKNVHYDELEDKKEKLEIANIIEPYNGRVSYQQMKIKEMIIMATHYFF